MALDGRKGQHYLRVQFADADNPLTVIETFQKQNSVRVNEEFKCCVPFLDLLEVPRLDLNRSLIGVLKERLLQEIKTASIDKLQRLLDLTFPSIHVNIIQPVCMEIMKRLPTVPQRYLALLENNQDIYDSLPLEVRRQLWQDNFQRFASEINPLIDKYLQDKDEAMFSLKFDKQQHFFNKAPRRRRQNDALQKIIQLIGKSAKLYDTTLQILRTLYYRNGTQHYCTLRLEILMTLHDNDVKEILMIDPCYRFAWCLDACLRDGLVDGKRCNELITLMEEATKESGMQQILGDFAIILADPFVIHILTKTIFDSIQLMCINELLPRDVPFLHSLLRLLSLGLNAWNMINRQQFAELHMDEEIVLRFIPTIMLLTSSTEDNTFCHADVDLEFFARCAYESPVANRIVCHYMLHLCTTHRLNDLGIVLPKLTPTFKIFNISDNIFLHLFVHQLVLSFLEEHGSQDFYHIIFEQFFLQLENEDCVKHMLRLLWFNYRRMRQSTVASVLESVSSNETNSKFIQEVRSSMLKSLEADKLRAKFSERK